MKIKTGDILRHKLSNQKMILIKTDGYSDGYSDYKKDDFCECRYYNQETGEYKDGEFCFAELVKEKEEKSIKMIKSQLKHMFGMYDNSEFFIRMKDNLSKNPFSRGINNDALSQIIWAVKDEVLRDVIKLLDDK